MSRSVLAPVRVAVAMVVLIVGLAGCVGTETQKEGESSGSTPFRLRIESTVWDTKTKMLAMEGQSASVHDGSEHLTITVDKVEGESATISTSEPMTPSGGSASPTDEFTVSNGAPVSFSSGGGTWTVAYEELTVE